ncbi:monocarboxylate transporter 9 [Parasteatoda tepidariorum]|uniref:monocarboxylate transporter 9 n=1 Tax=Parasteatoda tepidariorum TaxID=114398 RepID=UPI00077FBB1E|nr:uncharacterized protein LOC107449695 [Parasteatoda tepidariorum]
MKSGRDGFRAWVIAFDNFLINFIVVGLGRMSGILYIAFMKMFHIDRQTASMPFSIQQAARTFFGPLAGILGQKYGIRCVTIIGGIIGTISAISCYFVMDITWITVLWGLMFGICTALTTTLNQVPIDQYFDKYKTTAGGFAFSGGCVAAFIFPLILEHLIRSYGMARTFLVLGAFIFLVIPAACLLVEPPWIKKKKANTEEETLISNRTSYNTFSESKETIDFDYLKKESEIVFHLFILMMEDSEFFSGSVSTILGNFTNSLPLVKELEDLQNYLQNKSPKSETTSRSQETYKTYEDNPRWHFLADKLQQLSEKNHKALLLYFPETSHDEVAKVIGMLKTLNNGLSKPKFLEELTEFRRRLQEEKMAKQSNSFIHHIKTAVKLHANPIFLLICLSRGVFMLTFIPLVTIIVDFAMDQGLKQSTGKYLIPVLSLGDLLGRLCLGWINDSGLLSLPKFMLAVMLLLACSTATLPLMHSEVGIIPAILIFGMLEGSLFIRHQILVSMYMEEQEQAIGMGFINFLSGFIGFALPFYIGYFRDVRGSYDGMFYLNGGICAFIGALWIFVPSSSRK